MREIYSYKEVCFVSFIIFDYVLVWVYQKYSTSTSEIYWTILLLYSDQLRPCLSHNNFFDYPLSVMAQFEVEN